MDDLGMQLDALDGKLDSLRRSGEPFPETLFHYTNADGIKGIIASSSFRATSIYHLNDSSEFMYGLEVAANVLNDLTTESVDERRKKYLKQIGGGLSSQRRFTHPYFVCFCQEDNLLSMWRAYASKGYSIGVTCDGIKLKLIALNNFGNPKPDLACEWNLSLEKVEYCREKQSQLIIGLVKESLDLCNSLEQWQIAQLVERVSRQVILCLARFKNRAFKDEQEWRLINYCGAGKERHEVKFRAIEQGSLVPYVEATGFQTPQGKLPIKSVRTGPALLAEPTADAIRLLLQSENYDDQAIAIESSGIPVRW
jgi:hypothetical protein